VLGESVPFSDVYCGASGAPWINEKSHAIDETYLGDWLLDLSGNWYGYKHYIDIPNSPKTRRSCVERSIVIRDIGHQPEDEIHLPQQL
jgi:hypothetical protein